MTSAYRQELDQRLLALDDATAANYDLAFQNALLAVISYNKNEVTVTRLTLTRPLTPGGIWKHPERKEQLFQAFQRSKRPIMSANPQLAPYLPYGFPLPPGQAPFARAFPSSLPLPSRTITITSPGGLVSHATLKEEKDFYQDEQVNSEETFALQELGLEESDSDEDSEKEATNETPKELSTKELEDELVRCQQLVDQYASKDPNTMSDDQWADFEDCQANLANIPLLLQVRRVNKKEDEKSGGFGHWSTTVTIVNQLIEADKSRRLNQLILNDDAKRILADEEKKRPTEYATFWEPIVDWFNEDRRRSRYQLYRAIVEFFEANGCRPLSDMPSLTVDSNTWKVDGYWWNVDYPQQTASLPFVVPRLKPWNGWEVFLKSLIVVESDAKTTRSAPLTPITPGPKCKICGWQNTADTLDYTLTPPSLGVPRYRWTPLVKHYVGFHNYEPPREFRQLIQSRASSNQVASVMPSQLETIVHPRDAPSVDLWYFSPEELSDACV